MATSQNKTEGWRWRGSGSEQLRQVYDQVGATNDQSRLRSEEPVWQQSHSWNPIRCEADCVQFGYHGNPSLLFHLLWSQNKPDKMNASGWRTEKGPEGVNTTRPSERFSLIRPPHTGMGRVYVFWGSGEMGPGVLVPSRLWTGIWNWEFRTDGNCDRDGNDGVKL